MPTSCRERLASLTIPSTEMPEAREKAASKSQCCRTVLSPSVPDDFHNFLFLERRQHPSPKYLPPAGEKMPSQQNLMQHFEEETLINPPGLGRDFPSIFSGGPLSSICTTCTSSSKIPRQLRQMRSVTQLNPSVLPENICLNPTLF